MLPGRYTARITGAGLKPVSDRLALRAPREGVVATHTISTTRTGPNYTTVDATKRLYATFVFARDGRPRRHLTARWYPPNGQPPSERYRVNKDVIPIRRGYSYWQDPGGLAEGRWRCALLAGNRVVDDVSIRVG
jgi:hypothetical protein